MIASILVLATAVFLGQVSSENAGQDSNLENIISRGTRAVIPEQLTRVSNYWKVFSSLRSEAMFRCETRLYRYMTRKKLAEKLLPNSVSRTKRNIAAMVSDVKLAQSNTKVTEADLVACVEDIVSLQGAVDPFYREYQLLISEAERLGDQVNACQQAGGKVTITKREAKSPFDRQLIARSSPQMLRVYDNMQREKVTKEQQKKECFASLEIPASFPVQLEA